MPGREQQNVAALDTWSIKVAGVALPADVVNRLMSAEVDSSLEVPDMAVLRFHDDKLELVEGTLFDLGKELEIAPMKDGSPVSPALFKGEITAIEPTFEETTTVMLTIRGYDKRHRLNRETKTRSFVNVTDSDIVSQIVGSAGLSASAESTSQVRDTVFQQNQTDLEFLSELARRNGYEIAIDGASLKFRKPQTSSAATLQWGENLVSFQPRLSLAGQVNEVTVRGWDDKQAKAIVGKASSSASAPQIGLGKSGGQAAQSAISAAKHYEVRQVVHTQDEATKIAQRILDDINADFIEAEGVADAADVIRAGNVIEINQIGAKFSGKYHVTSATHVLEDSQYRVYFRIAGTRPKMMSDLVAPAAQSVQPYVGAAAAVVTDNNDPENMGRVKLKFPWYDDTVESWWARVAMPGAGPDRGFFMLPEVNDEVLVVFEHGDMNRPYVLGGLYSSTNAPPLTSSQAVAGGKVVNRMFKTTDGHVMTFSEKSDTNMIEIKDNQSNVTVKMDAGAKSMTTKSQGTYVVESQQAITIKSAGATVTIEASGGITIKSNGNISVESSAQLEVKGSMVTVQSSGPLALKGNPVQIN
jgi:phage protein D/phage baseplate assembly protein gpV